MPLVAPSLIPRPIHPERKKTCKCPKCSYSTTVSRGTRCSSKKCPKCGVALR